MGNLDVLENVVENLGQSVGAAFQKVGHALQQNVSMVNSVNSMMEHALLSSIDLQVASSLPATVEKECNTPRTSSTIQIRLIHQGLVPITRVSMRVSVHRATKDTILIEKVKAVSLSADSANSNDENTSPNETTQISSRDEAKLFSLLPHESLEWNIGVQVHREPQPCTVAVELSFPSPGTGMILRKQAKCNVSRFHFASRTLIQRSVVLPCTYQHVIELHPGFIHDELFGLHPFAGLNCEVHASRTTLTNESGGTSTCFMQVDETPTNTSVGFARVTLLSNDVEHLHETCETLNHLCAVWTKKPNGNSLTKVVPKLLLTPETILELEKNSN